MPTVRPSKDFYYLGLAEAASTRSTCMRKMYGAVIVKDDELIATGYNGAPRGRKNCNSCGYCKRIANNLPRGSDYTGSCRSVHAEMNAIIHAPRRDMLHSTLYLYGYDREHDEIVREPDCCSICKRLIINAGIERVVFADPEVGFINADKPYRCRSIMTETWIEDDDTLDTATSL